MILRGSSCSSSDPAISHAIVALSENFIEEENVIGDNACSEEMFHSVKAVDHCIDLVIMIGD